MCDSTRSTQGATLLFLSNNSVALPLFAWLKNNGENIMFFENMIRFYKKTIIPRKQTHKDTIEEFLRKIDNK